MDEGVFAFQTQWVLWMENDSCLKLAEGIRVSLGTKGPRDIELWKFEMERLRCFKTFDRRRIHFNRLSMSFVYEKQIMY